MELGGRTVRQVVPVGLGGGTVIHVTIEGCVVDVNITTSFDRPCS